MSKRIFTQGQINELLKNKHVLRCSEKSISYHKDFKIEAIRLYQAEGLPARQIFKQAGFEESIIGEKTARDRLGQWLKIFRLKGVDYLSKETRGGPGRRRSLANLTDQEKIKALELQNAYLKAENSFLVKLRAKSKR